MGPRWSSSKQPVPVYDNHALRAEDPARMHTSGKTAAGHCRDCPRANVFGHASAGSWSGTLDDAALA